MALVWLYLFLLNRLFNTLKHDVFALRGVWCPCVCEWWLGAFMSMSKQVKVESLLMQRLAMRAIAEFRSITMHPWLLSLVMDYEAISTSFWQWNMGLHFSAITKMGWLTFCGLHVFVVSSPTFYCYWRWACINYDVGVGMIRIWNVLLLVCALGFACAFYWCLWLDSILPTPFFLMLAVETLSLICAPFFCAFMWLLQWPEARFWASI